MTGHILALYKFRCSDFKVRDHHVFCLRLAIPSKNSNFYMIVHAFEDYDNGIMQWKAGTYYYRNLLKVPGGHVYLPIE